MKRVVFSMDDETHALLAYWVAQGKYKDMGEACGDALRLVKSLQAQADVGFTHLIVGDPATGDQRLAEWTAPRAKRCR